MPNSVSSSPRILLVEDDQNLGYLLKENMEEKGFDVSFCVDGKQGFKLFRQQEFELCILDVMLPLKDGFTLAKEIRAMNEKIPIIFLTSRSLEVDKIKGFQIGCDDYITKPFSVMELFLRINAVLKRAVPKDKATVSEIFSLGSFSFDSLNRLLTFLPDKSEKKLSSKETELLKILCEKPNELIHRQLVMNKVWGNDDYFIAKSMDVYITRLRKLLKSDPSIEIQNVYGTGFKLVLK